MIKHRKESIEDQLDSLNEEFIPIDKGHWLYDFSYTSYLVKYTPNIKDILTKLDFKESPKTRRLVLSKYSKNRTKVYVVFDINLVLKINEWVEEIKGHTDSVGETDEEGLSETLFNIYCEIKKM